MTASTRDDLVRYARVLPFVVICVLTLMAACSDTRSAEIIKDTSSENSFMPQIPRISIDELKSRLDAGDSIIVVDSRRHESYDKSHIPGAISLPLGNMAEPYPELAGYELIVTYCT